MYEYTGIPLNQIDGLNIVDYLIYRRDAFIWKMSMTESGRDYLDKAYRSTQTKPEREKLRKLFGKGVK